MYQRLFYYLIVRGGSLKYTYDARDQIHILTFTNARQVEQKATVNDSEINQQDSAQYIIETLCGRLLRVIEGPDALIKLTNRIIPNERLIAESCKTLMNQLRLRSFSRAEAIRLIAAYMEKVIPPASNNLPYRSEEV